MKAVQFPAQLQKIETKVDGSIKVIIETQELSGGDMAELFSYRNALGYVTFTPDAETKINVPKEPVESNAKSKSQIQRAVLYRLWEQSNKKIDSFEMFYNISMEKHIDSLKERLE